MSDSAFKTAAFPGCTTQELRDIVATGPSQGDLTILAEIARREKAIAGDMSVMTSGERLRYIRTGKAR